MKSGLFDFKEKILPFIKNNKKKIIWISSVAVIILATVIGCAIYVSHKVIEPISHTAINFSVFLRLSPCKVHT